MNSSSFLCQGSDDVCVRIVLQYPFGFVLGLFSISRRGKDVDLAILERYDEENHFLSPLGLHFVQVQVVPSGINP